MYIRTYIRTLPSQTSYVDLIAIINFSHIRKYTWAQIGERDYVPITRLSIHSPRRKLSLVGQANPLHNCACVRSPLGGAACVHLVDCPSWSYLDTVVHAHVQHNLPPLSGGVGRIKDLYTYVCTYIHMYVCMLQIQMCICGREGGRRAWKMKQCHT